ncbi:MAG: hypothetical protein ACSLFP_17320 [Acidimicrobiales bacterium]
MRALALGGLLLAAAACSTGQDPGVTPSTAPGPSTTSQVLQPCPPGGPDATTPAAGCLDADGSVVRP